MRIGEQRISLKNMSKNQRAYWREMKRLYDEAIRDGYNTTGQEWIETYAHGGKITREDIAGAKLMTGQELVGYSTDFDEYKQRVDNLLDKFEIIGTNKKKFRPSKGQLIKIQVGDMLQDLRNKYGDKVVWRGWCSLPYEVRAKVNSSDSKDRYNGIGALVDILEAYIDNEYNNEVNNEQYEEELDYDDEDVGDYE